jgi:hypothetical protein
MAMFTTALSVLHHAGREPVVMAARVGRVLGVFNPGQQVEIDAFLGPYRTALTRIALYSFEAVAALAVVGAILLRRRRTVPVFPLLAPVAVVLVTVGRDIQAHALSLRGRLRPGRADRDRDRRRRRSSQGAVGSAAGGAAQLVAGELFDAADKFRRTPEPLAELLGAHAAIPPGENAALDRSQGTGAAGALIGVPAVEAGQALDLLDEPATAPEPAGDLGVRHPGFLERQDPTFDRAQSLGIGH